MVPNCFVNIIFEKKFLFFFSYFLLKKVAVFVTFLKATGGGNRDRTCDLLNANQMLSQLSYAPEIGGLFR